jgi:type III pantothenate kinase
MATWRRRTNVDDTEDQLAGWLGTLFQMSGLPFRIEGIAVASVVPAMNQNLERLGQKWFEVRPWFLDGRTVPSLAVTYHPPEAVGADRLANAIGALARYRPPIIVVDFGTATTFDVIDAESRYIGGAILAGPALSLEALTGRTAKLPKVELLAPTSAIGRDTTGSLQSGVMLGYVGAINHLAAAIQAELKQPARVVATGGLGRIFSELCDGIQAYEPELTLDGIRLAYEARAT